MTVAGGYWLLSVGVIMCTPLLEACLLGWPSVDPPVNAQANVDIERHKQSGDVIRLSDAKGGIFIHCNIPWATSPQTDSIALCMICSTKRGTRRFVICAPLSTSSFRYAGMTASALTLFVVP
jgi:hypothetical protein